MASCRSFVSLLRSCYSTTARFFRDDLSIVTPITWHFTCEGAKWVGFENVFNARTWYGGTEGWPLLGEVEGASRQWSNGSGGCFALPQPQGTADQWLNGALKSEAGPNQPCFDTPDFPWQPRFTSIFDGILSQILQPGITDVLYAPIPYGSPPGPVLFFTVRRDRQRGCSCYQSRAVPFWSDGPPAFNVVPNAGFGILANITSQDGEVSTGDPFTFFNVWAADPPSC